MSLKIIILFIFLLKISISISLANNNNNNPKWTTKNGEEKDYLNWVRKLPSVKHSLFQEAKNKLKPCLTIKVCKKKRKSSSSSLRKFSSVQSAIDSIPLFNKCRVVISVGPGTYREKVEIPATMAYITIKGAGISKTVIEWDDTANTLGQTRQPLGTFGSATFAVNSPYFFAKNITFKNTAGAVGKQGQAVALRISADTAAFIGCKFIGSQDTLYDHTGRHYFKDCYIQGSVDFIFGNGLSLYEKCHLHATAGRYGALTAQKRESMLEDTGFSFLKCKVTGSGVLFLGRAWGSFSRVVFAYTYMDKIITPRGWYNWGDKSREMTVFYGQYKCSGAGANYGGRVTWSRELTKEEVKPFVSIDFIDGHQWLPKSLHRDS